MRGWLILWPLGILLSLSALVACAITLARPNAQAVSNTPEEEAWINPRDIAFYAKGKRIMFSWGDDRLGVGRIELWDTETGKHLASLTSSSPGSEFSLVTTAITPNGTRAFLAGRSINGFTILDVPHNRMLVWGDPWPQPWEPDYYGMVISPNSKYILLAASHKAELRSVATGKLVRILHQVPDDSAHPYPMVRVFGFSPDGKYAATAGGPQESVLISAVPSGKLIRRFYWGRIRQVLFSPDGRHLLTLSENLNPYEPKPNRVGLWEWRTGKLVREFRFSAANIGGQLEFTPNGKQLVVSGQQISVWDIQTGREIRRFPASPPQSRNDWFYTVRISPDGQYVLSLEAHITLWRLATGEFVRNFKIPKS